MVFGVLDHVNLDLSFGESFRNNFYYFCL